VAGAYWPQRRDENRAELVRVRLGESDETIVAVDCPAGWVKGDRVVLLVHGLAGSHLSSYMNRMARKLMKRGACVVRMNLRNCGIAFGLSRKTYHAGITRDARTVLGWIATRYPASPVTAVGFSLGGNLLLRMAGEDADQTTHPLDSLIAVSPALDLARSSRKLEVAPGSWIAQVFLRELIRDVNRLQRVYPDLARVEFPRKMTIREFDERHIAVTHGFKNADDYYERSSSLAVLDQIRVPTLIIGAKDDPVVELRGLETTKLPANVSLLLTEHGGHVGFLGFGRQKQETRWADDVTLAWMAHQKLLAR
jgi:predicted alpha/beta-fold hydrolase